MEAAGSRRETEDEQDIVAWAVDRSAVSGRHRRAAYQCSPSDTAKAKLSEVATRSTPPVARMGGMNGG